MTRLLGVLSLAALVAGPVLRAVARPSRAPAEPQASAAIRARRSAIDDFAARMGRLDGPMGVPSPTPVARAAEAGR